MSKIYAIIIYINNNRSLKHVTRFVLNIFMKTCNMFKKKMVGFLGGSVVKNLPDNAGSTGSILIQEDPLHHRPTEPMSLLSPWTTALKPACLDPALT